MKIEDITIVMSLLLLLLC